HSVAKGVDVGHQTNIIDLVYSSTPGGSWIQGRCFCCTCHTRVMLSGLIRRKPEVSVSPHMESSNPWMRFRVSSTPLVLLRQCLASSLELMLAKPCASVGR
ncbi:hypothetical protein GOODEAATRI_034339, partial [Goodea atripinnis]